MPEPVYVAQGATFDAERVYRYRLWRVWDAALPRVAFIMLNPSTADERKLDPTLRRCLGFARAWGCGSFEIGNVFALRSTDPRALYTHPDPIGPENDQVLLELAAAADFGVVAGWGSHGALQQRELQVAELLTRHRELLCLRVTQAGAPSHPLYLPGNARPVTYRRCAARRADPAPCCPQAKISEKGGRP